MKSVEKSGLVCYKFGFNGQLTDSEWQGGQSVSFEFRTEDVRLGRFLSTDPLTALTPWESPYAFAGNSPISNIDWLGLKAEPSNRGTGSGRQAPKGVKGEGATNRKKGAAGLAAQKMGEGTEDNLTPADSEGNIDGGNIEEIAVTATREHKMVTLEEVFGSVEEGGDNGYINPSGGSIYDPDYSEAHLSKDVTFLLLSTMGIDYIDNLLFGEVTYEETREMLMPGLGKAPLSRYQYKRFPGIVRTPRIDATKPYAKGRPDYSPTQMDDVWKAAEKAGNGVVVDPHYFKPSIINKSDDWQMGHRTGREYSHLHNAYMEGRITKEEFIKEYQNPDNYQPQLRTTNQSHIMESKNSTYWFDKGPNKRPHRTAEVPGS